jgi:transposase-like protein
LFPFRIHRSASTGVLPETTSRYRRKRSQFGDSAAKSMAAKEKTVSYPLQDRCEMAENQVVLADEREACALLESVRWPTGPSCPYCGFNGGVYELKAPPDQDARPGRKKCTECRRNFSVTVGSVLAGTHIPLRKWIAALELIYEGRCSSAVALKQALDLKSYSSALFLYRRIQWILAQQPFAAIRPAGRRDILRLLFEVKPTAQMPRPGAHRSSSLRDDVDQEGGTRRGHRQ